MTTVHHTSVLKPDHTVTVEYDRPASWCGQWVLAVNADHRRTVLARYASFTEARAHAARYTLAARSAQFEGITA